jgi:hypothetical protein
MNAHLLRFGLFRTIAIVQSQTFPTTQGLLETIPNDLVAAECFNGNCV